jgi:4-hydroxybenzoyl-CoA thioesterase
MKTHIHRVPIEWGDADPARIVFYPRYFAWFDAGTRHLWESVGIDMRTVFDRYGVMGIPIAEANAKFLSPSKFGDVIEVHSSIPEWGEKHFVVAHKVFNAGVQAVDGYERRVWAAERPDKPGRLKALPVPDEIRKLFE